MKMIQMICEDLPWEKNSHLTLEHVLVVEGHHHPDLPLDVARVRLHAIDHLYGQRLIPDLRIPPPALVHHAERSLPQLGADAVHL